MNKQRKVLITITYNEMGIIIDTKAEELDSSAQTEQRWIPCSEKLPDGRLNNSYLVQDKDGKRAVGTYTNWGWVFDHYMNDPVAWMPLPEPYKGEERQ